MWLISDKNINQAAKAAIEDLKINHPVISKQDRKIILLDFLKEFEVMFKYFRRTTSPVFDGRLYCTFLVNGLVKNPKDFGVAFGALVGMFKFHPEWVTYEKRINSIVDCINALNDTPSYRQMITKIIEVWKVEAQETLKLFEPSYEKNYHMLLQKIGQA